MKAGSRSSQSGQADSRSRRAGSQSSQSSQSGQATEQPEPPERLELPEQKQPVAACLTLRDWVCCWSAMNSSLPPDCNAWKVIARLQ